MVSPMVRDTPDGQAGYMTSEGEYMTTMIHADGTRPRPPVVGSLVYLVMNLLVGIAAFVTFAVLFSVGVGTAVVWVGLPLLAFAVVLCRVGGQVERARVYALLDTYIAVPHKPLPDTKRWQARIKDPATWKALTYFVLLLPIGIAEFSIMVAAWATSLGLFALPVYFRWLPDGEYRLWDWNHPWLVVDSTFEALPFAAVGMVLLAGTLVLTKAMGAAHARFARMLLGPSQASVGGGVL
ncbi:sensor domain-containing protein [Actinokineospora sp. HUAS TT18]|uniref:sensor domain-containing protein n=1 Tax=Actinokineospora sp. HUAS TT18 TaxID=3447451 RepID=UPI003F51BD69